jgi:hypothetical protein
MMKLNRCKDEKSKLKLFQETCDWVANQGGDADPNDLNMHLQLLTAFAKDPVTKNKMGPVAHNVAGLLTNKKIPPNTMAIGLHLLMNIGIEDPNVVKTMNDEGDTDAVMNMFFEDDDDDTVKTAFVEDDGSADECLNFFMAMNDDDDTNKKINKEKATAVINNIANKHPDLAKKCKMALELLNNGPVLGAGVGGVFNNGLYLAQMQLAGMDEKAKQKLFEETCDWVQNHGADASPDDLQLHLMLLTAFANDPAFKNKMGPAGHTVAGILGKKKLPPNVMAIGLHLLATIFNDDDGVVHSKPPGDDVDNVLDMFMDFGEDDDDTVHSANFVDDDGTADECVNFIMSMDDDDDNNKNLNKDKATDILNKIAKKNPRLAQKCRMALNQIGGEPQFGDGLAGMMNNELRLAQLQMIAAVKDKTEQGKDEKARQKLFQETCDWVQNHGADASPNDLQLHPHGRERVQQAGYL